MMDEHARKPMPDHDQWPVFSIPWDDHTPGPTDLSSLLPRPAGGQGFMRIVDGHLATGDGARWRMWGLNICTDMPLPPMPMAPIVAGRLAKYGVNCLRLHAMDHRWPKGILMRAKQSSPTTRYWGGQDESTRALDPEALARLDYFIACCKERGIYLDLNLNVARTFSTADGVAEAPLVRWGKGLTYFDEQLIALQKEYAEQLLSHVNPFTGLRYAEEPAIALVELVNENSLLEFWVRGFLNGGTPTPEVGHWYAIPETYMAELDGLWNRWLQKRYADRATLGQAWAGDLREYEDAATGSVRRLAPADFAAASAPRFHDQALFYTELERDYFLEMQTYLRGRLGVKQLLLGTSDHSRAWSALPLLQANAVLDIMDTHFYWQHPRSSKPGVQWRRNDWFIENSPMVDQPDVSVIGHCSRAAVLGKPLIASEVNEPFPNDYACEFIPIIAAYGSLQDWDGILFYDFDGSWGPPYWQDEEWRDPPVALTFALGTDPVKWPQVAAGALLFLRGDVRAAERTVARAMPQTFVWESLRTPQSATGSPYAMPGLTGRLPLVHRTAISSFDAAELSPGKEDVSLPEGRIVSDTGELTWEDTPGDGRVLVDTPRHQVLIGRAGRARTSNMECHWSNPFAAIQLASLEDRPIAEAGRLLLVTGARVANTGMKWLDETRRSLGEEWGAAPTRIEPVTGSLVLHGIRGATALQLQPLDASGQPLGPARSFAKGGTGWTVTLAGDPATPWYVIEIQRG